MSILDVSVIGVRHLGYITAACVVDKHNLKLYDPDPEVYRTMRRGENPFAVREPGLPGSFPERASGNFADSLEEAIHSAQVIWVCFDTPVENDKADNEYIARQIRTCFPYLEDDQVVLISSQVEVGFTRRLQQEYLSQYSKRVSFAYSPENIRRGRGLETFCGQDRIVIGSDYKIPLLEDLLLPFCPSLHWVSLESAEMVKHALNGFLAMSIAYINEISDLCRVVGADIEHVQKALQTEQRVGQYSYMRAGGPYTGGTLGRDIATLDHLGKLYGIASFLPEAIQASNTARLPQAVSA